MINVDDDSWSNGQEDTCPLASAVARLDMTLVRLEKAVASSKETHSTAEYPDKATIVAVHKAAVSQLTYTIDRLRRLLEE